MLGAWLPSYLLEVKGAEEARSRFNLAALWGGSVCLLLLLSLSPLIQLPSSFTDFSLVLVL